MPAGRRHWKGSIGCSGISEEVRLNGEIDHYARSRNTQTRNKTSHFQFSRLLASSFATRHGIRKQGRITRTSTGIAVVPTGETKKEKKVRTLGIGYECRLPLLYVGTAVRKNTKVLTNLSALHCCRADICI